jgi:hypothetical protein
MPQPRPHSRCHPACPELLGDQRGMLAGARIRFSFTSSTSLTSFTSSFPSPLKSTLPAKHRVSPCFDRYRPHTTSLESTLAQTPLRNLFKCNTYEKMGEGVCPLTINPMKNFYPEGPSAPKDLSSFVYRGPSVPLQPPPQGATMTWNRETSPLPPVSNLIERTSGAATQRAAPGRESRA